MKKSLFTVAMFSLFLYTELASENYLDIERQFIKGSITDKIQCVQNSDGKNAVGIAKRGIDYAIENSQVLGDDRELSTLALASILALPKSVPSDIVSQEETSAITQKLITVFNRFEDETVKIAALNRLVSYSGKTKTDFTKVLNDFLHKSLLENTQSSLLIDNAIVSLAEIGDSDSFSIVYSIWKEGKWNQYKNDIENTLIKLAEKNPGETIKMISSQSIEENSRFFTIVTKSYSISNIFKSEVAENLLSLIINSAENMNESVSDFLHLQHESFKLITENKWAHASNLVVENLKLSKTEFDQGLITQEQFVEVIKNSTKLGTPEIAKVLSDFLADFNNSVKENAAPAEPVVLATIQMLGELGDKTAFDNLLYVTYLNYSSELKTAAKDALSKLKW